MKLKPLPTFTIRDCKKAGACGDGVKFYGDGFGMDTKINVCDILSTKSRAMTFGTCEWNSDDAKWVMKSLFKKYTSTYGDWSYTPEGQPQYNIYCRECMLYSLAHLGYDVTGELQR